MCLEGIYFGGDPTFDLTLNGNSGNDEFNFDYAISRNITSLGGNGSDTFNLIQSPGTSGILTLQGNNGSDTK